MKTLSLIIAALLVFAFAQKEAAAQPFSIDWHTIDAGGGTSTGGGFELSGTIAQHDAGPSTGDLIGGSFDLGGGYWTVSQVCYCPGDLNHDGEKNGGDIQQFVNCLLSGGDCSCADVDLAGGVNVDDAMQFVADLLSGASCP